MDLQHELPEKVRLEWSESNTGSFLNPLGIGNPHDVAKAVVFLASDGADWITGINLTVDGGFTAQ